VSGIGIGTGVGTTTGSSVCPSRPTGRRRVQS